MKDLKIKYSDNGVFTDFSKKAKDFLRDEFSLTLKTTDAIYVGLYKRFNTFFAELSTFNTEESELSIKYYNGTSFVNFPYTDDDTNGFDRSGFFRVTREEQWEATTIDGEEFYWIEITTNVDTSLLTFKGINLIFSDDNQLRQEQRLIDDFLAEGDSSFIAYSVASRNEIMRRLRNEGKGKNIEDRPLEEVTKWDLLEPEQLSEASKFLTLSKIMFDSSSETDDKHFQKYLSYRNAYNEAYRVFYLSIDKNDDGIKDDREVNQIQYGKVLRR